MSGLPAGVIEVTDELWISEDELEEDFVRSSGPGGQNVNRVATAVQLRFDLCRSPSLPSDVRARLIALAGRRVTGEGVLVIEAQRFRTREQNRRDARERLVELIRKAARKPRARVRTRPSAAAKRRRLESKKRRSETKKLRGRVKEP